jgi:uncharacterized protein (DUF2252 family)
MTANLLQRIQAFNQGRDPERLTLKYQAMRHDAFAFLRGTCHLFYEDFPQETQLNQSPITWICGDLHLENFGTYKADNRLVYFDLNDFDEATLAPCTWELARFLTSVLIGAETLNLADEDALKLCEQFIDSYRKTLISGKPQWIERSTAKGMIKQLLNDLKNRSRADFIAQRTDKNHLYIDNKKALPVSQADYDKVQHAIEQFAEIQENPKFFKVLDIARRIAGTGSLGLERYIILIHGKGNKEGHYLLDLKYQPSSALKSNIAQPIWRNEAERVVSVQTHVQAVAPAFLNVIEIDDRAYSLKELSPTQDRLHLNKWDGKFSRLEKVFQTMGMLVASAHLRTSGWKGAATTDEWIAFGEQTTWQTQLFDYTENYSKQVKQDWQHFSAAVDEGIFNLL